MAQQRTLEAETLLAHAGWMHALAARLVGDAETADDVVQDAWIAAWRHQPDAQRALEPWLARVVRNFAWKRRRSDQRRTEHELRSPAREATAAPASTAERLELQRLLVDAVAALEEPLRTTVVLHYFEGRTSAEIALAQGIPAGTVRWRLKRGLDELRERLDAHFGSRAAWGLVLAPFALRFEEAATAAAGVGTATTTGAVAMSMALKVVAAVGVLAAAGVLWWSSSDAGRAAQARVEVVAEPATREEQAAQPSELVVDDESVREGVATPAAIVAGSAPAAPQPVAAPPRSAWVRARFVDSLGAPWEGVSFEPRGLAKSGALSDADGRVLLEMSLWGDSAEVPVELVARRTGCATKSLNATLPVARETDLGEVVLLPGSRVIGRVVDDHGRVREGAYVGLAAVEFDEPDEAHLRRHGDGSFDRIVNVVSERDGAFALDGVPAGQWRLYGIAEASRYGWTEPFEVVAGADVFGIEVRVPAMLETDRITGIVLDPSGEPVPNARMLHTYSTEHESGSVGGNSDDQGRFEIVIQRDTTYDFFAFDPDNRYVAAFADDIAPGTRDLELRLGEKSYFQVRVRDREGKPVDGCTFGIALGADQAHQIGGDRDATPVEPGVYQLARPPIEFALSVEAPGFKPFDEQELSPPTEGEIRDVVLERARVLRGRVTADRIPLEGAHVALFAERPDTRILRDGFPCRFDPSARAESTSGNAGAFEIGCDVEDTLWLRVTATGWAAALVGPLRPATAAAGELEIELTRGGAIEGRVILADGRDAAGEIVGVNCGDAAPRTMRAGPQGRYRFEALTPGTWQVTLAAREIRPNSTTTSIVDGTATLDWPCVVRADATTRFDLDLSAK